jgi:TolA-binding protein
MFLALSGGTAYGVLPTFDFWMELDAPHPYCERPVSLDLSADAYFPIANPVPEKDDFNAIVSTFRAREWAKFDVEIREFTFKYEKSALRQVLEFLKVNAAYERLSDNDEGGERKADYALRQALLLYPNSKLAPVAYAAAGQHLLRTEQYQRGLEVFRTARDKYAASEYTCLLESGVLEGSYMLQEWAELDASGEKILEKCTNFRIRALTRLRVAEANLLRGKPDAGDALEKAVAADNPFAERFVPTTLFNLGELRYQQKQYKAAEYFLDRYLKTSRDDASCGARAQKRLADIAYLQKEDIPKVAGKYLEVFDRYPRTDEGKFSRAHALFLSADLSKANELLRRLKWVEANVDSISQEMLRFRVYLEKGIVQWLAGDANVLEYLERLQHRKVVDLRQRAVGKLIRAQLVKYWSIDKLSNIESVAAADHVLKELEWDYDFWMKGYDLDDWATGRFAALGVSLVSELVAVDAKGALDLFQQLTVRPLFPKQSLPNVVRAKLGEALLKWQLDAPEKSAVMLMSRHQQLSPILGPDYKVVGQLAQSVVVPKEMRQPSAVAETKLIIPKHASKDFQLATALVWIAQGQFDSARSTLTRLAQGHREAMVDQALLNLDIKEEKWVDAYQRYRGHLSSKASVDYNRAQIESMARLCREKNLIVQSLEMPKIAQKFLASDPMVYELRLLSASAWMAQGKVDRAIDDLETFLAANLESKSNAEAHFRLGQALWKKQQKDAARDHWLKVLQQGDPVWAPLAQNELKLADDTTPKVNN